MKIKFAGLLGALGALGLISANVNADSTWISTYHSRIFSGNQAHATCVSEAARIADTFPREQATREQVTLIEVACERLADGRSRLNMVYEHSVGARIQKLSEVLPIGGGCKGVLKNVRGAFRRADLPLIDAYCTETSVIVEFIDPLRIELERYSVSPRFESSVSCEASFFELRRAFDVAGMIPVVGGCYERRELTGNRTYFERALVYASSLESRVATLRARQAASLESCEAGLSDVATAFFDANLRPVDYFCARKGDSYVQTISYLNGLIETVRTQTSGTYQDAAACEIGRGSMIRFLVEGGSTVLHSYCEEILHPGSGAIFGYRYRVHYIRNSAERVPSA